MSVKDKLKTKRRIYIIAHSPSRAVDWMIAHGFLEESVWRDPRVVILCKVEQAREITESPDFHFQFLDGWKRGTSQEFKNVLWRRLPHLMPHVHVV